MKRTSCKRILAKDYARISSPQLVGHLTCLGHVDNRHIRAIANRFIFRFAVSVPWREAMFRRRRMSSKDFCALADILWKGNAFVRYQNPDGWIVR